MTSGDGVGKTGKVKTIYKQLLKAYGYQGWWPVTVSKEAGPKYFPGDYSHPRNEKEAWEIIVGAILTQNTSWKNVEKAIVNLINSKCLDLECISKMKTEKLAKLIKPSGYYNQKANRLKSLAKYLEKWPSLEAFFDRPVEEIRKELLAIKGIGKETADSILLYAGKKPIFVVDAYTRRIFHRLGLTNESLDYDDIRKLVESELSKAKNKREIFNEFHALLVEHAKRHCRKKPICKDCPLAGICHASKT